MRVILFLLAAALQCHLSIQFDNRCAIRAKSKRDVDDQLLLRDERGNVDVFGVKFNDPNLELITLKVAEALSGYVPFIGPWLAAVAGMFWPTGAADVWDQMKDQVNRHVNAKFDRVTENFWNGIQRQFNFIALLEKRGDESTKLTRMHSLDTTMGVHESQMKNMATDNPLKSLIQFVPFASLRLTLLSDLVCTEKPKSKSRLVFMETYVHKLAEYSAYFTLEVERAKNWRMGAIKCSTDTGFFSSRCAYKDTVTGETKNAPGSLTSSRCQRWCRDQKRPAAAKTLELLTELGKVVPHWVKAYNVGLAAVQQRKKVKDTTCATLANLFDYTAAVSKSKGGRACMKWTSYYRDWEVKQWFPFDNGDPKNYCRIPINKQPIKKKPYCLTGFARFEECDVGPNYRCEGFQSSYHSVMLKKRSLDLSEE